MEFRRGGEGQVAVTAEGGEIPQETLDELKRAYKLDKPWYVAYPLWLADVAVFDFGESTRYREPVIDLIKERLPVSLTFGLTGFLLAYLISIPLGVMKAVKHRSVFDFVSSAIVFVGYSIPGWALGALLLVLFAGGQFVQWFPLGGFRSATYDELPGVVRSWEDPVKVHDDFGQFQWQSLSVSSKVVDQGTHMVLPVFCYMLAFFASLTIVTKNALLENIGQDYVRTAFAKGLSPRRVIFVHAMRNSLIPLATGLGNALSVLMAGSYLIEAVFNIDGIGYFGYRAIVARDYPVVLGILAINFILTLFGNLLSDFLYAAIDPRIRFQ
jgi:microcin C transport system permease protein